jgi:hypothetical protein
MWSRNAADSIPSIQSHAKAKATKAALARQMTSEQIVQGFRLAREFQPSGALESGASLHVLDRAEQPKGFRLKKKVLDCLRRAAERDGETLKQVANALLEAHGR